MEIREEDEPLAQARVLRLDRLLDLEEELRVGPHRLDGADLRAGALVVGVGERAPVAGGRLDEHVMAALDELARARRGERDAVLVGLDLFGDADPQSGETLARAPSASRG